MTRAVIILALAGALLLPGCLNEVPSSEETRSGPDTGDGTAPGDGGAPGQGERSISGDEPGSGVPDELDGLWRIELPGGHLGGEPSIAAAPDGRTLYVVAVDGPNDLNRLWRSQDAGRSWSYLGPVAEAFGSNDATIAVDSDGAVWVGTYWSQAPDGYPGVTDSDPYCTAVSLSTDQGESWDTNPYGCGVPVGIDERPWIAVGDPGAVLLHSQPNARVAGPWVLTSSQDNAEWTTRGTPAATSNVVSPPVAHGPEVSFIFGQLAPSAEGFSFLGPVLATTPDLGATWTMTRLAEERIDGRFIQLALGDGVGLAVWSQLLEDGSMGLRGSQLEPGGWSPPFDLVETGTNALPWIARSGEHLAVAYLHAEPSAHPAEVEASTPWQVHVWTPNGTTVFPWTVHEGPLCNAYGSACRVPLGDFFSADLLPDGTPVVAIAVDVEGAGDFNSSPVHVLVGRPS